MADRRRSLRFSFARRTLLALVPMLAPLGCALVDGSVTTTDDVTSVENTDVKSQAIGNCWLYATAGWAESLHKGATGRDVDLSEAYWNYWYWYEQITDGSIVLPKDDGYPRRKVTQGGWWGLGAELIRRYGWMHEHDFIPASDDKAARHSAAVDALNVELGRGTLASFEARHDPRIVRDALNRAWQLTPDVVAALEATFPLPPAPASEGAGDGPEIDDAGATADAGSAPSDGGEDLDASVDDAGATADAGPPKPKPVPPPPEPFVDLADRRSDAATIHVPQELPVLSADGQRTISLSDVVGTKAHGTAVGDGIREGVEAWTELRYTWNNTERGYARREAFLKNLRDVLNRRLAVPIAWVISNKAQDGAYRNEGLDAWSLGGLHESLLVDYEIDDVPGYGTLRVDERETRPEALEATLSDQAVLQFFRIKNSWGTERIWSDEELRQYGAPVEYEADGGVKNKPNYLPSKPGYNDLYLTYLDRSTDRGEKENGHVMFRLALPSQLRFAIPELAEPAPAAETDASTDAAPSDDAAP